MSRRSLTVLVVDDEPHARRTLRELLGEDEAVAEALEAADGEEAVEALAARDIDLVFLDVQMPGTSGLEVIEAVGPDAMPPTVFVTAYDRYALPAFDAEALDYLLKPFDDERFYEALDRAKRRIASGEAEDLVARLRAVLDAREESTSGEVAESGEARLLERVPVHGPDRVRFVPAGEIDWIGHGDRSAEIHVGEKALPVRFTLEELEERLDPSRFLRIHRSTIVNVDRVVEIQPWFHGAWVVLLDDGTTLRMSRRRKDDAERVLGPVF